MRHVISLGAGVQSSTMALMASEGLILPMPDGAVFADTQDEPAAVYRWLDWLEPRLKFPVHRVTVGRLSDQEVRIRTSGTTGRYYRRPLIPAYMPGGAPAFRHCTQEFKLRPLFRGYRTIFGISARATTPQITQWLGISLDETQRIKPSRMRWCQSRWPLVYDVPMTRGACLQWMAARGFPTPPRSACVFCPYHSDREWQRLKVSEPEDFAAAVDFERRVQATCDEVGQTRVFLHASLKPIDEVVFVDDRQTEMWSEECEGMCGV